MLPNHEKILLFTLATFLQMLYIPYVVKRVLTTLSYFLVTFKNCCNWLSFFVTFEKCCNWLFLHTSEHTLKLEKNTELQANQELHEPNGSRLHVWIPKSPCHLYDKNKLFMYAWDEKYILPTRNNKNGKIYINL